MTVLSSFFGIVILMRWNDHLPPHFYAQYGDFEVMIDLNGEVLDGIFPLRAMALVREWMALHSEELQENWKRMCLRQPLENIDPLE